MSAQGFFLTIVAAILTASVGVMNASRWRLAQIYRHLQGADGEILLHAVADGPLRRGSGLYE